MAKIKYFCGEIELAGIDTMKPVEFAERFPGVTGIRRYTDRLVGRPATETPVWDKEAQRYVSTILPAERCVEYKSSPSRHQCDARCMNASGKIMKCECACGGKNHGRGTLSSYRLEAA